MCLLTPLFSKSKCAPQLSCLWRALFYLGQGTQFLDLNIKRLKPHDLPGVLGSLVFSKAILDHQLLDNLTGRNAHAFQNIYSAENTLFHTFFHAFLFSGIINPFAIVTHRFEPPFDAVSYFHAVFVF